MDSYSCKNQSIKIYTPRRYKMNTKLLKLILKHITIGGLLILLVFIFSVFKIPCLFRFITGLPCPSCGMTRSFLSLLSFDFAASFAYHPLLIPALITIFIALHINVNEFKLNKRFCNVYFILFAIIFFIVYLVRLILGILP